MTSKKHPPSVECNCKACDREAKKAARAKRAEKRDRAILRNCFFGVRHSVN